MIGAVFVAVVSGAKGRMECLDKCGVSGRCEIEEPRLVRRQVICKYSMKRISESGAMSDDKRVFMEMMTALRLSSSLEKKELSSQRLRNAAEKKDPPKPSSSPEKKK